MHVESSLPSSLDEPSLQALRDFFNNRHDKLLCTANANGEPSVSLMGTPRLLPDGALEFEVSDRVSTTLDNIRVNKSVALVAYDPALRARDYVGARLYAHVQEIASSGPKFDAVHARILERHGADKAAELQATVSCRVTKVRPLVDRGQRWDEPPFDD